MMDSSHPSALQKAPAMKNLLPLLALLALPAFATECIVPSKPGGAMDLTCKLAAAGMKTDPKAPAVHLSYLPGGIGAVAWQALASRRGTEADTLVAFSGGSLLNIAQGKFGKASVGDVRWVAALGADYGMIAVRSDSQFRTLADLVAALRQDPSKVLIGVSGTIGSQDWLKMARLAQQSGIDPKVLRFVALEGGGEAFTAMHANYVQVVSGDASEATLYAGQGKVRVLAVLSEKRLPGVLAGVPTAREQGVDLVWPIIRGVWMGPKVPDAEYRRWVAAFDRMMATPGFARERAAHGFYPFSMTGDALTSYVQTAVDDYKRQARQFNLVR
jgi:putative tricarboxylic transport membrane protein